MNIVLHFEASFDAVYSINGVFIEKPDNIRYEDGQALYVTVYPLKAMHLPYTVKMIGGRIVTNKELCSSYALPRDNFFIKLKPRLNYVYSPITHMPLSDNVNGTVYRFFGLIKNGNIAEARHMMTSALNSSIADTDINDFFEGFVEIIPNKFYEDADENTYFLVDKSGKCDLYKFVILDGAIDNIKAES